MDVFNADVNCKLYADDVKLYTEVRSMSNLFCFQDCLDALYHWSLVWQLPISCHKCCIIDIGKPVLARDECRCYLGTELLGEPECVSDLGVTIVKNLCFSDHIANITRKAHQRANLIHRCFISKNIDLLVRAFKTYVRPILEYNSPVWSPSLKKDIILVESVQRRFTKRIPGLDTMTCHSRLKLLNLESLEVRRLRSDLAFAYKILFGATCINSYTLFMPKNQPHLRGHKYTLMKSRYACQVRRGFFSTRVVNIWNNLPADTTDFSSLCKFRSSVTTSYLLRFCTVYFE